MLVLLNLVISNLCFLAKGTNHARQVQVYTLNFVMRGSMRTFADRLTYKSCFDCFPDICSATKPELGLKAKESLMFIQ